MRSPARAFAWELGRRHRWGWAALGAWLLVLLVTRLVTAATGHTVFADWGAGFAFAVVVPGTVALFWLVVLFTHGHSGSIAARQSILPARSFTLPVTSTALTAWPMFYAAATVLFLWIAIRVLVVRPADFPGRMPYLWPGLLAVVLVAWAQALVWLSYPLPGLRVVVAVLWLATVETVAIIAIGLRASEGVMVAVLVPQLPLAYLVARHAVARARRGEVPDWRGAVARLSWDAREPAPAKRAFASAETAQLWLEWKRFGWSLPIMVALVLPAELALLWPSRGTPALVFAVLAIAVLTPPFLASFTAVTVRKSGGADDYGVSPFTATRPLPSAALVGARFRMAARSAAATWLLLMGATPAALAASGTWGIVADRAHGFAAAVGMDRAIVAAALTLGMLGLTTWRQMVQSLYLGLTGRPRLIKGSAFATLGLLVAIGPLLEWAWTGGARSWLWVGLFGALAAVVAARTVLVWWIAIRLWRDRLVGARVLVAGAALWLTAVLVVYAVLLWWFSTPYAPRFLLLMVAIVSVPLVRLSAAPLALAWNRHR
jgi:hypothetical protein